MAGSRKSRKTYDAVDRENKVLPSAIKVFDCASGKCLARFEGHLEEIHCLKLVRHLLLHMSCLSYSFVSDNVLYLGPISRENVSSHGLRRWIFN